jgi:competence protein ComEA
MRQVSRLSLVLAVAALLGLGASIASAKTASHASHASGAKIDLNTATEKELESLPGVGEATAKKIVAGRPYASVDDLAKAGVSSQTIGKIKSQVTVTVSGGPAGASAAATAATPSAKSSHGHAKGAAAASVAAPAAVSGGLVDVNTASEKELESLPGVGPATAKKIVAGRPYGAVGDLAKAGVPSGTVQKIAPLVTVSGHAAPAAAAAPAAPATMPAAARPVPASAPSAGAAPAAAAAPSAAAHSPSDYPERTPPAKGMVWVNTATKTYHYEGDQWYGRTKEGKFMTESDANAAGYRAAKKGGSAHPKG